MANVTKKECCLGTNHYGWSNERHRSGSLFYWKIAGNMYPCRPCKVNCTRSDCKPKCLSKSNCSFKKQQKGPVCGTNGKTYANQCKLQRHQCRRENQLKIAYFGPCQKSCEKVNCPKGKSCFLNFYRRPQCARCQQNCHSNIKSQVICSINNVTYRNYCSSRQAACQHGYIISVAYKGPCKEFANCSTVNCPKRNKCIFDDINKMPICMNCPISCFSSLPICASDGKTYDSLCHLMKQICRKGMMISVVKNEPCNSQDEIQ